MLSGEIIHSNGFYYIKCNEKNLINTSAPRNCLTKLRINPNESMMTVNLRKHSNCPSQWL